MNILRKHMLKNRLVSEVSLSNLQAKIMVNKMVDLAQGKLNSQIWTDLAEKYFSELQIEKSYLLHSDKFNVSF